VARGEKAEGASVDQNRVDRLAQTLAGISTRRTTLGLGAAGFLGALGREPAGAKKNKKKTCKKCGPCKKCVKGKCKPKAAGTPCGAGQQCFADGTCNACDVCLGDCAFTSLQDAIDAARDGARIQLCPGTYSTTASWRGQELTVVGAGAGKGGTVLDGHGRGGVLTIFETVLDLRQLTITGGGGEDAGAGIFAFQCDLTLEEVHITGNVTTAGGGGIYDFNSDVTLIDSRVTDNSARDGGGIFNQRGTLRLTAGSIVTGNTVSTSGGAGGVLNVGEGGTVEISGGSQVTGNTLPNCTGTEAC
jgi:hypothetical protein